MKRDVIKGADLLIEKVLESNRQDRGKIAKSIEEAERKKAEAEKQLSDAIDSLDTAEHHRLKDIIRQASDEIDLYTEKLRRLEQAPLISEVDYKTLRAELIDSQIVRTKRLRQKTAERLKEISEMLESETKSMQELNKTLRTLTVDVYRSDKPFNGFTDTTGTYMQISGMLRAPAASTLMMSADDKK